LNDVVVDDDNDDDDYDNYCTIVYSIRIFIQSDTFPGLSCL